jgi:hypothetical protein
MFSFKNAMMPEATKTSNPTNTIVRRVSPNAL